MGDRISAVKTLPTRRTLSSLVLGAGFCLTGAGTVMLGVLLPLFSERWGLRDDGAGFLLLLQFSGSALGAVFTSSNRVRSLTTGYGLLVISTCALAFTGSRVPFAPFFLYGLGLGLAMTSTSLLITERSGDEKAQRLQALNFVWSAGAAAGPMLFVSFLHKGDLRNFFLVLMALFLLLVVWAVLRERHEPSDAAAIRLESPASGAAGFLFPLVILSVCAVGIEASMTGWLATYSHRTGLGSMAGAALATSLFWFGGMLSRLAFSTRLLAKIGRRATLEATVWGVAASVAVLILAPYPAVILAMAGVAGACTGPLYPLLLSFMLERSARGWIFAVGGFGASLFPWLTGLLSWHFHSLRYGLIAPCGAAFLMAVLRPLALRSKNSREMAASAEK